MILQSFIHTIAYTLYCACRVDVLSSGARRLTRAFADVVSMGVEALHEEYTELYFKLGIVVREPEHASPVAADRSPRQWSRWR